LEVNPRKAVKVKLLSTQSSNKVINNASVVSQSCAGML
jgi:hypothetical protein